MKKLALTLTIVAAMVPAVPGAAEPITPDTTIMLGGDLVFDPGTLPLAEPAD